MIDGIANQPGRTAPTTTVAPLQPTPPVAPARQPSSGTNGGDTAQAGGVARTMAASAPVDADRVQKIKRAIAEGKFPILPATIADRLIALKLAWNPNGDASHDEA